MEPTANDMLSDVVPSNGTGAQSAFDKVISQRQKQSVEQTETGLGESQSTFDTVIQQRKSPKTQLNSTFASVSGINPDDAAKAQQVGGAIGLGQDLTMRNAAEAKRIADQKRFEMYDLMESDPILGRQMMRREFASVAHDDIPQLTSVGALFKVAYSAATLSPFPKDVALEISQQYEGTQYQTEEALIYHWMNNNNLEEKDLSEETRQRLNFLEQNAPPPINTYLFGGLSYAAGQARSMAPEVAKYAIAGGVTGGALGLAGGPLAPATVAGGVLTGIGLGATAGVGVVTSQIESGMLYKDLLRSGVPKETARTASRIGGTISGLIEMGTLGLAVAPFKMVIKKTVGDVIATRLEKTTVGSAVKTAGKYYAMSEGGEQIEELSQYATAVAVEEFAKSFTDSDYVTIFETPEGRKKFIEQMVDISYQTWKATAIIGSFGPVLNLAVDAKNIRDSAKTKQFLTDLSKNVQATKLKGRSPSALANFVAAQAQGTAAETMYVDAEEMVNVLNQSGLTAQQIDNALPGVREQLSKATSGGDIQIPTAQFAANIVGTKLEAPLMEHARLAPDAISAKQAIAQQETMQQNMKDAQVEMAVQEVTNAQFVREAKEIEKVVNDQLVAAGRPPTEALFAAKLVQARAVTGAAAAGITPAQWVAQHPVPTFRSQQQATQQAPAQGSFEQASRADLNLGEQAAFDEASQRPEIVTWAKEKFGDRTAPDGSSVWQNFTEWFGDSKVVDAEGKPMVVYHGTKSNFLEFRNDRPIWVAETASHAGEFVAGGRRLMGEKPKKGSTIYPLFVSIKNPIVLKGFEYGGKTTVEQILAENNLPYNEDALRRIAKSNIDSGYVSVSNQVADPISYLVEGYRTLTPIFNILDNSGFIKSLVDAGFDGIKTEEVSAKTQEKSVTYAAFEPTQIKSAIANVGTFGQQDPNILRQEAVPATFYSALSVEVGKSTTKSASADSWKQQIKGLIAKGVVKEKEVYWSGLNNWLDLQEGKITKEQVQAFLDAGGVKVEVQQKSDDLALKEAVETGTAQAYLALQDADAISEDIAFAFDELEEINAEGGDDYRRGQLHAIIDVALDEQFGTSIDDYIEGESEGGGLDAPTKYSRYQLPGGTNYREALVTLPSDALGTRKIMEGDKVVAIAKNDPYRSAHWDQPNVLVHLRMNDRVDADGKKVLFVEEVQSDWGQAGREKGFVDFKEKAALEKEGRELVEQSALKRDEALQALKNWKNKKWGTGSTIEILDEIVAMSRDGQEWADTFGIESNSDIATINDYIQTANKSVAVDIQLTKGDFGIPTAPFVETTSGWLELGLKQILLEAVNGGYDRVAFVDGDQSVQRYRKALTEAVDEVEITRNDDGTYTYSAIKNGAPVQGEQSVSANRINEVFGKAGSKQLLEEADAKPDEIHTIASGDIEIGGEGMRKFYDTIVPQALGKMLKKLGGDKIGEVKIEKSVGRKINAKEISNQAVKLINDKITINEFRAETDLEKSDVSDVALEELQQANRDTSDKARTREIANAFAANLKVKFAGGKSMTQQGFTVTPALAEQVSQGLPLFQAATGGTRGEIDPVRNLITIKNANSLTVFHELMHWFVIDLFRTATDSAASELSKSDADILLKWFGIGGSNMQERIANWNAMTLEEQRRHHETAAYNAEIWVTTGRAPSVELQGVFERFRRWATRAYKSIRDDLNDIYRDNFGTDLPFLTDEVRGVFDRMLASEEQISRREAIDNFKGMYQTQEESGMSDAVWAAMQAQNAESHEMGVTQLLKETVKEMKWESGAKEGFLKKMQDAEDGFRKVIRSEESDKMGNEPARKAERFFKTGKMVDPDGKEIEVLVGNKIDSVAVGGMYPTSTTGLAPAVDLTKLRGMTMEGGLAPDLAAEMFGFSSGDQLIRALAELKPFKDELKERTDARMLDEHGGMNTEAEKEEAVNKALANEVRARQVAVENRYLTKVKTPVAVIMQGAKELARTILGRMAIKDIKPRNYVAAEARVAKDKHTAVKAMQSPETAGKSAYTRSFNEQIAAGVEESVAASEALVKSVEAIKRAQAKIDAHKKQYGDVDPAIVAKKASHQQVIQNQLAKEGYKILEEVDKALAYVKRIVSDVNRKNMGADHADQIEAILERFGLMGKYVAPTTRTPLATWAQVQQDIGFDIEIPDIVQESVRKNFLELTPEEFQDVIDTVKQIAHTGKAQQLVLTMDRKITFEKAKTEIVESINENAGGRKAKTRTAATNVGLSVEAVGAFFAAHLKAAIIVQIMDGGKEAGKLWNYLVRSANNAANKETTMRAAATKRISEILDPVFKNGKMGGAGVYFPSVDRSLNREQVLAVALNMGNEGNMQRLLDGEGWTLEQVMPIIQTLTAAELNAVQEIWDHSETYKTEIIEMYRRTAGREPQMLEPKPFQVMSSDGQIVSLKGGYYPAKYDPKASARTQSLTAAEQALRDLRDARMASTTRNSYAKPRSKEVHDRPLLLNLSALYSGIGEVIHDLSWREWLIDANRLMRSSSFDKAVREQYGSDFLKQIKTWIEDVAAGDKGATNAGEMALNYLRQGVSAAGLGFNLMSAVGQITGFAQSVVKVGAKWIGRGIAVSASNPSAAIERVYGLSSFMANRGSTQFRELNEIKNMVRGENVAMKRVRVGTYFLMMQMQRMVDVPTWIGAYEKQLSINSDEKLAIAIADQAVIDSQGGGMLKDLSAIERGGPIQKLFTVFYSFMNTNLNLAVLKGMTEKNAGKWVAQQTMLWVVPVVTMYMLKKLLTPQAGDDDDKFDLKEMAKELAAEELSFLMGSFMVVREFADAAKIFTDTKTYGTDYRGPAGLRMIGDTYKFATQAAQLEFDTAFRKAAINIIGSSSGLPAAQINRTIDGIEALLEGETENITAPLFGVKKR
jgi:hypothetical protein